MIIKRVSMLTGDSHQKDLPVTQEQLDRWEAGELLQDVFTHLNASDREFIKTGVIDSEWASAAFCEGCQV
jgi:hypothetical protein